MVVGPVAVKADLRFVGKKLTGKYRQIDSRTEVYEAV